MIRKNAPSNKLNTTGPVYPVDYGGFLGNIITLLSESRIAAGRVVSSIMAATYWEVGRRIVEYEQKGEARAEYGVMLLKRLAADLTARFGRGFGYSNLNLFRQFYLAYPQHNQILQTASGELAPETHKQSGFRLAWSHYVRLLPIEDGVKRAFYEEEAVRGNRSVRQLDRQIDAMLFERVALSRKKAALLEKADRDGEGITSEDAIKDPYILDFLGLPERHSEKDLENALIAHLTDFLLEMGYGFTFVARQRRLQIGGESFYIDILLYHRKLRCLVVIDLKIGRFSHADAGQMNMYLNYLRENETADGEQPPIGLILCTEKNEAVAHYALGGLTNKIFASHYKLQLPDPAVLTQEIEVERRRFEQARKI